MKVTFVFFVLGEGNKKQRYGMRKELDKLLGDPGLSNKLIFDLTGYNPGGS